MSYVWSARESKKQPKWVFKPENQNQNHLCNEYWIGFYASAETFPTSCTRFGHFPWPPGVTLDITCLVPQLHRDVL